MDIVCSICSGTKPTVFRPEENEVNSHPKCAQMDLTEPGSETNISTSQCHDTIYAGPENTWLCFFLSSLYSFVNTSWIWSLLLITADWVRLKAWFLSVIIWPTSNTKEVQIPVQSYLCVFITILRNQLILHLFAHRPLVELMIRAHDSHKFQSRFRLSAMMNHFYSYFLLPRIHLQQESKQM